jgi:hypothetical protein
MAKGKKRRESSPDHDIFSQDSRFLRLPGEIRTKIYRAALVKPDAIELWPHKFIPEPRNDPVLEARLGPKKPHFNPRVHDTFNPRIRDQQDLVFVRKELAIGLLGTCRQLRMEATRIFWSENQFCFSGDFEWTGLRRFLTTVGPEARSMISRLDVALPFVLCVTSPIEITSRHYHRNEEKNHPKLRMAKLFANRRGGGRWGLKTYTEGNFAFVKHLLYEEHMLQELRFVVPHGWHIVDASGCQEYELHQLRFAGPTVVLEDGSQMDDHEGIQHLIERGFNVRAMPGALIIAQPTLPTWNLPPRASLMVTEITEWRPPAEEEDDIIRDISPLYDEGFCIDAARQARRGSKEDPRLKRELKGFGGCRFVVRRGTYCVDCRQPIVFTGNRYHHHYQETGSYCVHCNGRGGMKWMQGIEVRKHSREQRVHRVNAGSAEIEIDGGEES